MVVLGQAPRYSRFVRSTNDDNQYIDPPIFYKYKKAFEKYKKSHKHINLDFSPNSKHSDTPLETLPVFYPENHGNGAKRSDDF